MLVDKHTSQEALGKHAVQIGANNDERLRLEQIEWSFDEHFPTSRLLEIMSLADWTEWFDDEMQMIKEDRGSDESWRCLLVEEIEEAVVILDHEGLLIWDGYHRCAASLIKGQEFMKVVCGRELRLEKTFSAGSMFGS